MSHVDISEEESAALNAAMAPYTSLVESSDNLEGSASQADFSAAMVSAVSNQVLGDLCDRCFSEEELSKTRLRIASANQQPAAEEEKSEEPEPAAEEEAQAEPAAEETAAVEPEAAAEEEKETAEEPAQEEAPTQEPA